MDRNRGKIPVYTEVVRVSVHTPTKVVTNGTTGQRATTTASDTQHTGTADRTRPQAIQGVAGEYTNVYLDTSVTTQHLDEARTALQHGDPDAADKALASIQSAVTSETIAANLPLIRARENLIIAAEQVRAKDYSAAQVTLGVAVKALEDYANGFGAAHAADARALGHQIVVYAQRLQTDHDNAAGQIENFWDRIASWSEPSVAKGSR